MDELWQRYRSFWVPVLIGLGVFLIGLIVVHVVTDDPEVANKRVVNEAKKVKKIITPTKAQEKAAPANAKVFKGRVVDWAKRLDAAGLEDPVEFAVARSLESAILRGIDPETLRRSLENPESDEARRELDAFDGDETAAARALHRYRTAVGERLTLLRTGDPNVGFTRLLSDVWTEFQLRANRADAELPTGTMGFSGIPPVTRTSLAQRLLNLALVAEIVDLGIRSGVRSILSIRVDPRPDMDLNVTFLKEWPVRMELLGDMLSLQPILDFLTDQTHPVPLTQLTLTQPSRKSDAALGGLVKLYFEASSMLVRPDASLDLDQEDQRQ